MFVYYIITTVVFCVALLSYRIQKKKWPIVPLIVFASVTFNFILYLQGWSSAMHEPVYPETYCMIGTVQLLFSLYCKLPNQGFAETHFKVKKIRMGRLRLNCSIIILAICLILCMFENYILIGDFVAKDPSAHTSSVPILSSVLKGLYPIAGMITFIDYDATKKKTLLIFALFVLAYSIIGSQGRFWPVCALITTLFFISYRRYRLRLASVAKSWFAVLKIRYKLLIIVSFAISFSILLNLGASRINTFTYAELLQYTGPGKGKVFGEIFSWYYGYFPFSFYNLNTTIHHIFSSGCYTYGQFLINPYACFLHIDDLLGIDYSAITKSSRIVQLNVATVATGYYEFFADFGYLFPIGIMVFIIYTRYFEKKKTFVGYACYSYMLVVWFMMSFLNMYTIGIFIYFILFAVILGKWFVIQTE